MKEPLTNPEDRLSPRLKEVKALALQGFKNREIAEQLGISLQVVKNYMRAIFLTLGVETRLELVVWEERQAARRRIMRA